MDQSDTIKDLLPTLLLHAEAEAQQLGSAIIANPTSTSTLHSRSMQDIDILSREIPKWFISLFTNHENCTPHRWGRRTRLMQNYTHLPLSLLLSNLEIVLQSGRVVTSRCPQSELAFRVFVLKLADNLAEQQIEVEQQLESVSDLLLLK